MSWKEHKKARNSGGNSSNQLVTKARNEPATNTDHIDSDMLREILRGVELQSRHTSFTGSAERSATHPTWPRPLERVTPPTEIGTALSKQHSRYGNHSPGHIMPPREVHQVAVTGMPAPYRISKRTRHSSLEYYEQQKHAQSSELKRFRHEDQVGNVPFPGHIGTSANRNAAASFRECEPTAARVARLSLSDNVFSRPTSRDVSEQVSDAMFQEGRRLDRLSNEAQRISLALKRGKAEWQRVVAELAKYNVPAAPLPFFYQDPVYESKNATGQQANYDSFRR